MKKSVASRISSLWQETWDLQVHNKLHYIKPSIGLWPALPIREADVKLTRLRIGHTRATHKHLLFGRRWPSGKVSADEPCSKPESTEGPPCLWATLNMI
ncbi:hypothetical protein AVEN_113763-1 [Araneus ventricosus]|uniref:Uncharacterized protein n=1 Tax=Araneus ventricosus TaxID=182803 RepID=A0A4Y2LHG1_ARAVE|nr:hypothetical protein AVEN_113763-1 [Araneus ventricosus]